MGAKLNPLQLQGHEVELPHSLFRFPGKLHPPLVQNIIAREPAAKTWMDSMAGCGTVPLETIASGRDGLFGDIDPVSCLVTRAKTNPFPGTELLEQVGQILDYAELPSKGDSSAASAERAMHRAQAAGYGKPANALHWFEPHVAEGLANLLTALSDTSAGMTAQAKDALEAIFASSVRRLSRADPTPVSCVGVTKVRLAQLAAGHNFDVARTVRMKAKYLARGYDALLNLPALGSAEVVQGDARSWAATCAARGFQGDMAITSPPYCHAIEYWRRHRLEYSWLNLVDLTDIGSYNKQFIGTTRSNDTDVSSVRLPRIANRLLNQVKAQGGAQAEHLLRQYFADLQTWLVEYRTALKPGGTLFVVAGANTVRQVPVDTPRVVAEIAKGLGMESTISQRYLYENTVMQYPTHHGHRVRGEGIVRIAATAAG